MLVLLLDPVQEISGVCSFLCNVHPLSEMNLCDFLLFVAFPSVFCCWDTAYQTFPLIQIPFEFYITWHGS